MSLSVDPAEARPGETVALKVTAKLNPGWHIYTQAKTQPEDGPRKTVFDLFDPAGLEVAGDWKASRKPESKAEPAFENQVFEYFEDEVTWSIPLKVPTGTPAGKKEIHLQASYQLCNAQSCSFPGRWTLNAATLTVLGSEPAPAREVKREVQRPRLPSGPARKDTPARMRPKGVTLTPSVEPAEAHPGQTVAYQVKVVLQPRLHIYPVAKDGEEPEGWIPTRFDFFDTAGLKTSGTWKPDREPEAHLDPTLGNQPVQYYEHEVTWTVNLAVPTDATPGKRTLRCQAGYQICNERSCFPESRWTLPDVTLNIVAGAAPAAANVSPQPASPAPVASPPSPEPSPSALAAVQPSAPALSSSSTSKPVDEPVSSASSSSSSLSSSSTPSAPMSEIARRAQEGLIPFLFASALGGLLALVMPCVWPMVPVTVNFFVKQGHGKGKGNTVGLAVTYCLAIIAIFTGVGVLFSFFFSASFLQNLANNPWLNLVVAALFVAFGLSLLGLFEIRLPNFMLNASARGESRGGVIGVIFMALTLTITSFTCTFPVVGGLLVMAAGGNFLYPILGLATFATVLALPFFLLALSPSLIAKMPKSGDWMNTVKVVGGLVEIGAALKFLNTAELGYVTPENAWFDASVVLTSWIALSAVCGFYLLGFFRMDHDHDEVRVGPGRMIFGSLFVGMALYMAPALFGRPPRSMIWDRMIVGLLPPDATEFNARPEIIGGGTALANGAWAPTEVKATSTDPEQAQREEKKVHGVVWGMSLDQAKEVAAAQKKPILIDFTGVNCSNCRQMENGVLPKPQAVKVLREFVTIQLYNDRVPIASLTSAQRQELAEKNLAFQMDLIQESTTPIYVVLTPEGKFVSSLGGFNELPVFVDFLTKSLEKARGGTKVASRQAEP
ncbi:MAG: protein-disulfide reductase DsbD domain-containing protein [Isosphaeraceae bacterium]